MPKFRYFRVVTPEGVAHYRVDEDAPTGSRVRALVDGWWAPVPEMPTSSYSLAGRRITRTEIAAAEVPCIFCDVVAGRVSFTFIHEWRETVSISAQPSGSVNEFDHLLVLPKDHVPDAAANPLITAMTAARATELGIRRFGTDFHLVTNCGEWADQTIFHLHWHVRRRRRNDGVVMWWTPPAGYLVATPGQPPTVGDSPSVHMLREDADAELALRDTGATLYALYQIRDPFSSEKSEGRCWAGTP